MVKVHLTYCNSENYSYKCKHIGIKEINTRAQSGFSVWVFSVYGHSALFSFIMTNRLHAVGGYGV